MIAVRPDLGSAERVQIDGDGFYVHKGHLRIHKGDVLVAEFRIWAYAINLDNDLGKVEIGGPELPAGVTLTPQPPVVTRSPVREFRPLSLGMPNGS